MQIGNLAAALALSVSICTAAQAESAQDDGWVPIAVQDGRLTIETQIGGHKGLSIVDTGAAINAINQRFIAESGVDLKRMNNMRIAGVNDVATVNAYETVEIGLFGTSLKIHSVPEVAIGGPDVQMLLGAGFLNNFIFQFDYPNERMRILPRGSIDLKKQKNVDSKLDRDGSGYPMVKVRLNDEINVWMLLDTGATAIVVDRGIATKRKWLDQFPAQGARVHGVNAARDYQVLTLPTVKIGPYELGDSIVMVPPPGRPVAFFRKEMVTGSNVRTTGSRIRGIVGADILRHFLVTVDYQIGAVHLFAPGG